jgi:hypothetical protein
MPFFAIQILYMKNKFILFTTIIICLFITLPFVASCQPDFDDREVDAPIDGGITLLIAAGATVGLKKIRDNKQKNKK